MLYCRNEFNTRWLVTLSPFTSLQVRLQMEGERARHDAGRLMCFTNFRNATLERIPALRTAPPHQMSPL